MSISNVFTTVAEYEHVSIEHCTLNSRLVTRVEKALGQNQLLIMYLLATCIYHPTTASLQLLRHSVDDRADVWC